MANPREVFMQMLAAKKKAAQGGATTPTPKGKLDPKAQAAADKADMKRCNTPG